MSGLLPSEQSLVVNSVIDKFSFNDFTEKKWIGRGGGGEVFYGYNGRLGTVAFKVFKKPVKKTDMSEAILLAQYFIHPNIIRLLGFLTPEEGYLPNNESFCIGYIMEYMEKGSLYNVIHNSSVKYDMKQVYSWIEKASSGLQYLHEKGVLHRDINPRNILLGKSLDDLRISDFGLAKVVELQTIASHTYGIGTVDYMAPELHDGTEYRKVKYGKSADIYSLTITFWEIIHRKRPYGHLGGIPEYVRIERILNGERPNIEEELEISALLKRGWDSNPENRPEISEFIEFSRKERPNRNDLILDGQQNTSVLILGGDGYLNTIYLLDSNTQSWKKLRITLPMGMREFGAVVLNEEIYIFGGFSVDDYQQHCYKLKNAGSRMKLAWLNQKRAYISSSSLVYKGDIWVIGGSSGEALNSVEKYDIYEDKWTYMPEMNHPRSHAAAAVFKDRIIVTGGWNGERSVEMFDPEPQKWLLFCDLPIGISRHSMLISNSTLSIFGGTSNTLDPLNSVWEMDIKDPEKKWTKNQSFKHKRCRFGIGILLNRIIVFGGWRENGETSEIFDGNEWIDGPKLPQNLSQFAYTSISRSFEEKFLEQNTSVEEMKNRFLTTLTELKTAREHAGVDLLDEAFDFFRGCNQVSIVPMSLFTSEEREKTDLQIIDCLPLLNKGIKFRLNILGLESAMLVRSRRSGLQFIKDNFGEDNAWLNYEMTEQLTEVSELDRMLAAWNGEQGEYDCGNAAVDLRGVPESHDWWSEGERAASDRVFGKR